MVDAPIPVEHNSTKMTEALVPVCPACVTELTNAESVYLFRRLNPDTRWFWCPSCEGHIGYHRMKKTWYVDPFDYERSAKLRENFGLPDVTQQ